MVRTNCRQPRDPGCERCVKGGLECRGGPLPSACAPCSYRKQTCSQASKRVKRERAADIEVPGRLPTGDSRARRVTSKRVVDTEDEIEEVVAPGVKKRKTEVEVVLPPRTLKVSDLAELAASSDELVKHWAFEIEGVAKDAEKAAQEAGRAAKDAEKAARSARETSRRAMKMLGLASDLVKSSSAIRGGFKGLVKGKAREQ
jgi:hypothetical protein